EVAAALGHEADAALQTLPRRQALDAFAPEDDLTREEAIGAVDRAQERRFTGAIAADQGGDRPGVQLGREVTHDRVVAIARRDGNEVKNGRAHAKPRISAAAISGVMPR